MYFLSFWFLLVLLNSCKCYYKQFYEHKSISTREIKVVYKNPNIEILKAFILIERFGHCHATNSRYFKQDEYSIELAKQELKDRVAKDLVRKNFIKVGLIEQESGDLMVTAQIGVFELD